uniref:Uncharacterized protein n=1 Tax=Rhizophora mucronata TaxID=61149 RepID=A0A2P2QF61_RHIMU
MSFLGIFVKYMALGNQRMFSMS